MTRHLFDCWTQVSARVRTADTLRVFLDFDGTLAPLCATPEKVRLGEDTRRALRRLVRHNRVRAAIVSGRRRGDLIRLVRLQRVQYWGLYGWERRRGRSLPVEARRVVAGARDRLTSLLQGLPGVWIEDKGFGFSVHVRGASAIAEGQARGFLRHVLVRYRPDLHIVPGRRVWNVLPRQVPGKGPAVQEALRRAQPTSLSIYVGDDATDEPAFAILRRGITVRVGATRDTNARYRLSNPAEVRSLIERLDGELS